MDIGNCTIFILTFFYFVEANVYFFAPYLDGWLLLFPEPHIAELFIVYAFVQKKRLDLSASSCSHVCFFKVAGISWT